MKHILLTQERIITGIVLAVSVIIYNFIWINKTLVLPEGLLEFYSELIDAGMIPYKDFYYYLPPLNLFIDYLFWKCSFGYILVYRVWRLIERILIIELMFYILSKRIHPYVAGIGCFLAAVLFSASVCDLGGDYNQTVQLLLILNLFFFLKYLNTIDDVSCNKYKILIGCTMGCMGLCKQPLIPGYGIIFILAFIILILYGYEKNPFKALLYIAAGALIPILIVFLYLIKNDALDGFIYQAFIDTGSKGTIYQILFGRLLYSFYNKWLFITIVIGVFLSYIVRTEKLNIFNKYKNITARDVYISTVWITISFSLFGYHEKIFHNILILYQSGIIYLVMFQIFAILVIKYYKINEKISFLCIGFFSYMILIVNYNDSTEKFFRYSNAFNSVRFIPTMLFFVLLIWMIYHLAICKLHREQVDIRAIIISCLGLASGYTMMMANGEPGVSSLPAVLIIPAFVYLIFKDKETRLFKCLLEISTLVIFSVCLSQKLVCPYSWWGDTEESYWKKTEVSNIRALQGFKFSKREKEKYDCLNEIIKKNSDENSCIWSFPYCNLYNVFQNNYNMNGFVPILFYDLCADDFAVQEALNMSMNPPDIIVWINIPNCMEVHEMMFRNGRRIGQRLIQKWFSDTKRKYILIGQVDNVFVYKLNDGSEFYSKYICDIHALNTTAYYDYHRNSLIENGL